MPLRDLDVFLLGTAMPVLVSLTAIPATRQAIRHAGLAYCYSESVTQKTFSPLTERAGREGHASEHSPRAGVSSARKNTVERGIVGKATRGVKDKEHRLNINPA